MSRPPLASDGTHSDPQTIDLSYSENVQFKRKEWIECGKKVHQLPPYVLDAISTEMEIPLAVREKLPANNCPVEEFLHWQCKIPERSSSFHIFSPKSCFSKQKPTDRAEVLLTRPLLAQRAINTLKQMSLQALLDGAQSFVDVRYTNSRLPLHAITVLDRLSVIERGQRKWLGAMEWLEKQTGKEKALADSLKRALERMGWNEPVQGFVTTAHTLRLTTILSTDWLNDELLDIWIDTVQDKRAQKESKGQAVPKNVVVAPALFGAHLSSLLERNNKKGSEQHPKLPSDLSLLHKFAYLVCKIPKQTLVFVWNVDQLHWVTVKVDFASGKIHLGDSMSNGRALPRGLLKALRLWVNAAQGLEKSAIKLVVGEPVPVEEQGDTYSCGIIAATTLANIALGDSEKPWTSDRSSLIRLKGMQAIVERLFASRGLVWDELDLQSSLPAQSDADESTPIPTKPQRNSDTAHESETKSISSHGEGDGIMSDTEASTDTEMHSRSSEEGQIAMEYAMRESAPHRRSHVNPETDDCILGGDSEGLLSEATGEYEGDSMEMDETAGRNAFAVLMSSGRGGQGADGRNTGIPTEKNVHQTRKRRRSSDMGATFGGSGAVGLSASVNRTREVNGRVVQGTFKWKEKSWETWVTKLENLDAEPIPEHPKKVRHLKCGKELSMKEPGNVANLEKHLMSCNPRHGSRLITTFFKFQSKSSTPSAASSSKAEPNEALMPCPGLTKRNNSRIPVYVLRKMANFGGGGRSISSIAKELYPQKAWADLTPDHIAQVRISQQLSWKWIVDPQNVLVRAMDCEKVIAASHPDPPPCKQCQSILTLKAFKNALRIEPPPPENLKYTRLVDRVPGHIGTLFAEVKGLADLVKESSEASPYVRFAIKAIRGDFRGNEHRVLLGLVSANVARHDRQLRGVGMQNFKYDVHYDEFMATVSVLSPRVGRLMAKHLPVRSERSRQAQRSAKPRFPLSITEGCFDRAEQYLKKYDYSGPTHLGCDDTKLLAALRPFYESSSKEWLLVGGVNGPIKIGTIESVADISSLEKVLTNSEVIKATKLRLWMLSIPFPGVPPLILAAVPIASDMSATQLHRFNVQLSQGLTNRKIHVISYAADGTVTERNVQRFWVSSFGDAARLYSIAHPAGNGNAMAVTIKYSSATGFYSTVVQDHAHYPKTSRNNLFSGARVLTLGNYIAAYHQVYTLIDESGCPIFRRDVVKLDRQDDRAATRLFSASTLEFLASTKPEWRGLMVYLFVFGELADAFANREISHGERLQMAIRTKFFCEMWRLFLSANGYSENRYYISNDMHNIVEMLVDGLLSLIVIHRDHLPGAPPFFPWLHGTAANEHCFGVVRQIVTDFTALDFLYSALKAEIVMEGDFRLFSQSKSLDAESRARASGYHHVYMSSADPKSAGNLAIYPSDSEIEKIVQAAYEESASLWALLGVQIRELSTGEAPKTVTEPPSEVEEESDEDAEDEDDSDSAEDSEPEHRGEEGKDRGQDGGQDDGQDDGQESEEEVSHKPQLSESETATLLKMMNDPNLRNGIIPERTEQIVIAMEAASVSVLVEDHLRRLTEWESLNESDGPLPEGLQEVRTNLALLTALQDVFRPTRTDVEIAELGSDFKAITELRRQHETRAAKKGVKVQARGNIVSPETEPKDDNDISRIAKKDIIREFNRVLASEEIRGSSTGRNRSERWKEEEGKTIKVVAEVQTGNSLNAAYKAEQEGKKAVQARSRAFKSLACHSLIAEAGLNLVEQPRLMPGDFGIILSSYNPAGAEPSTSIRLGKVISIYSKGGGKGSNHAYVESAKTISAPSYIIVQLFDPYSLNGENNRFVAAKTFRSRTFAFEHLNRNAFLRRLISRPADVPHTSLGHIRLSSEDLNAYIAINRESVGIAQAVKTLGARKKKNAIPEE